MKGLPFMQETPTWTTTSAEPSFLYIYMHGIAVLALSRDSRGAHIWGICVTQRHSLWGVFPTFRRLQLERRHRHCQVSSIYTCTASQYFHLAGTHVVPIYEGLALPHAIPCGESSLQVTSTWTTTSAESSFHYIYMHGIGGEKKFLHLAGTHVCRKVDWWTPNEIKDLKADQATKKLIIEDLQISHNEKENLTHSALLRGTCVAARNFSWLLTSCQNYVTPRNFSDQQHFHLCCANLWGICVTCNFSNLQRCHSSLAYLRRICVTPRDFPYWHVEFPLRTGEFDFNDNIGEPSF